MLHDRAEGKRVALASEDRKTVQRRAIADHLSTRNALPTRQVVPSAGRKRDVDLAAGGNDRRDQQRVAAHELRLVGPRQRVGREGERHRSQHRQTGRDGLCDHTLQIRKQTVTEFDPLARDRFVFVAECPRFAGADAVHPHVRAEHTHLQPAQVQLRRWLHRAVEAADVAGVVRHAAHAPRQSAADARRQAFPVALRVAAPLDRISLAAGPAGTGPDHGQAVLAAEFFGCLVHAAVVEQWIDVVQALAPVAVERDRVIRNVLAEVAHDDIDARFEQRSVRVAPPRIGSGIGEIDQPALRQRGQHVTEGRGLRRSIPVEDKGVTVRGLQQVVLVRELLKQRRVNGYVRIFPHTDLKRVRLDSRQHRRWVAKALRIPTKIETRLDVPCRAAVEGQHVAGNAAGAKLGGNRGGLLGRSIVGFGDPQP